MKFLILCALIILGSCKLKVEKGNSVVRTFVVGGNCHLVELAQDAVCVEYKYGSLTNSQIDTDCDAQEAYYSALNITTHFSSYLPTIDCRDGGKVGLCSFNTKRITYYDNEWTNAAAETDCTTLNGDYSEL